MCLGVNEKGRPEGFGKALIGEKKGCQSLSKRTRPGQRQRDDSAVLVKNNLRL